MIHWTDDFGLAAVKELVLTALANDHRSSLENILNLVVVGAKAERDDQSDVWYNYSYYRMAPCFLTGTPFIKSKRFKMRRSKFGALGRTIPSIALSHRLRTTDTAACARIVLVAIYSLAGLLNEEGEN